METIDNHAGPINVEITIPLPVLCKVTGEPQSGSILTWRYQAADRLLALGACRAWPEQHLSEPLDLETFTRRAAQDAALAVLVIVETIGHYILKDGTILRCHTSSLSTALAAINDSPISR